MADFKFILGVETVIRMWKADVYKKQYDRVNKNAVSYISRYIKILCIPSAGNNNC
jgi:hypothetical protein